jgi:hypothetical protein
MVHYVGGAIREPSDDSEEEEEEGDYTDHRHHADDEQRDVRVEQNLHLEAAEIVERALQPGGIDSDSDDNDSDSDHLPAPIFIDHLSYHNETTTASHMMMSQQEQQFHHHQQQQQHHHHTTIPTATMLTQDTFFTMD